MKNALKKLSLLFIVLGSTISLSFAQTPMSNANGNVAGNWTCTTNASSAVSGSPEEQADNDMAKNGKEGTAAFAFAMQHCRDCTKITCSKQ